MRMKLVDDVLRIEWSSMINGCLVSGGRAGICDDFDFRDAMASLDLLGVQREDGPVPDEDTVRAQLTSRYHDADHITLPDGRDLGRWLFRAARQTQPLRRVRYGRVIY